MLLFIAEAEDYSFFCFKHLPYIPRDAFKSVGTFILKCAAKELWITLAIESNTGIDIWHTEEFHLLFCRTLNTDPIPKCLMFSLVFFSVMYILFL